MTAQRSRFPRLKMFVVSAAAALALAACGGSDQASPAAEGTEASPAASATGTHDGHSAGSGAAVDMRLIQYRPEVLEVAPGTEVTWTQSDAGFHTVTSGTVAQDGGGVTGEADGIFASERLATGQTFKFSFAEAGTYPYFCEIHPATMTGEVRVGA